VFLDFKDDVAVAKARVRLAKVRAEFGLAYLPSPPSLVERVAAFMAEEKAKAEKRKKARAGVAAAKERARAYLGPVLVP